MTRRVVAWAIGAWTAILALPGVVHAAAQLPSPSPSQSPAWQLVQSSPLNAYLDQINRQTAGKLPPISLHNVIGSLLHGGGQLAPDKILSALWSSFVGDLLHEGHLLGELVALGVICALLELLSHSFDREDVSRFGTAAAYIALAVLAFTTFFGAAQMARGTVGTLVSLMEAMLPLLTTLLAAVGAVTTAGLFHPLMLVAINMIALLVQNVVVPALIAAVVLDIVGQISGYKLSGLASLVKQVGLWSLGAGLTLFIGLIGLYGAAGPVADGVALRTGKFLANTFIPVVGKLFSDATEMVFGSTFLLKDAVGLVGLLAIAFIVVLPLIKILVLILVFRLSAAVLAPIGGRLVVDALGQFASSLSYLAVAMGATGVMFFLSMTIVFSAGKGVWG